jgi:hypothetical protein
MQNVTCASLVFVLLFASHLLSRAGMTCHRADWADQVRVGMQKPASTRPPLKAAMVRFNLKL